jgi:hypothetical protein
MNPTTNDLVSTLDAVPISPWSALLSLGVIVVSLMVPTLAIALCVMKSPARSADDEFGLGSVSLHDEMWDFVAAVERGEVSLVSLGPPSEPGTAPLIAGNPPPGGSASRRLAG